MPSSVSSTDSQPSEKKENDSKDSQQTVEVTSVSTTSLYTTLSKAVIRRLYLDSLDDLCNPVFYRDVVVECILCAYVICLVIWCLVTLIPAAYEPSTTHFGLFAGFFIMYVIEAYGPVCGAPINPAGVWGFFLAGRISLARLILYTGAEIGGAAAGAMTGFYLTPIKQRQTFGALLPGPGLEPAAGMAIEAILTFNLLFVALCCTDPKHKTVVHSFPIAFCIGVGIMSAGTHTGGLQNPLVPFGPAVVTGNFTHHWLYWIGPYIGATVGSLFYTLVKYMKDHCEFHITKHMEKKKKKKNRQSIAVIDSNGNLKHCGQPVYIISSRKNHHRLSETPSYVVSTKARSHSRRNSSARSSPTPPSGNIRMRSQTSQVELVPEYERDQDMTEFQS